MSISQIGVALFALCALSVAPLAFANTVVIDNVKWSATHVDTSHTAPECTAYSKRRLDKQVDDPDAVDIALKLLGTAVATVAMSRVGHSNGGVPDPCRSGF
ncbi:hypothetical protein G3N95_13325 [Paraburkholderia sp. Tr-20389]|uniref:hypothetical protein n=1 Tax=Paraburkholderia sp. Tr-20389 TaxID=2703903 RepID=UPI00197FA52E|nr:hypothetical protein [Paraburkholderia sp. Tr-20389]MBN3753926.1 hypothetical protein [Paraburkholderia sp. Tr-20389]